MTQFARCSRFLLVIVAAGLFVPDFAIAQEAVGSITGVVKDASGGVLPGVAVEVASPALIEKTRETITAANGRYNVVSLAPGVYTVTFSLQGFSTSKREGISLTAGFAATIDTELRVGAQEETITVTAEAPVVDITSGKHETVLNSDAIEALPTSRIHSSLVQLIPGLEATSQDVGGTIVAGGLVQGHGMHGNDTRDMVNGLVFASSRSAGSSTSTPNVGAYEEASVDYSGVGADAATGGIQINLVPKEGGNTLKSSSYLTYANSSWQNSNLTNDLIARGLTVQGAIKNNSDFNPGIGGPIKRDRLWFFLSARNITANNYVGGLYVNANAGDPTNLTYVPTNVQAVNNHNWRDNQFRTTWQISRRNKLAWTIEALKHAELPSGASATTALEAAATSKHAQKYQFNVDYTFPVTNKVLFEAHTFWREDDWSTQNQDGTQNPLISPITIQSTGFNYANQKNFNDSHNIGWYTRAALSYVTGSHNFKLGVSDEPSWLTAGMNVINPTYIRVSTPLQSGGVPNQITLNAFPNYPHLDTKLNLGIYAQDKWTLHRLTAGLGLRYDHFVGGWRTETFGPTVLAPNRNITFPAGTAQDWQDITPRLSLTYDLFGDGKTAIKTSLNKFMGAVASGSGLTSQMNPFSGLVTSTTRTWTEPAGYQYTGGNLVPNCDLTNPLANGGPSGTTCGIDSNTNFGTNIGGTVIDPNLARGWGKRDFSWEFSTGVQREIVRGMSAEVSYFHRWYGNFIVTDNLAVKASDYTQFSVVAPTGAVFPSAPAGTTLPNGGGYTIGGLYDLNPALNGVPAQNFTTEASNYGKQTETWDGVDVSVRARLPFGLTLQGGTSTGKSALNSCAIRAALPETAALNPFCDVNTGFLTEISGYATYTIPKVGVLASVTIQNRPSRALGATVTGGGGVNGSLAYGLQNNQVFPCGAGTAIAAQLGHNCTDAGGNVTVPLITPYSLSAPRFSQIDVRLGKVVRVGRTKTTLNLDLYNAMNSNSILSSNTSYAVWQQPTAILQPRFVKVGMNFDF